MDPAGINREPPPASYAIGIDMGGSKIAGGVVNLANGRVIARRRRSTMPQRGPKEVFADVKAISSELRDQVQSQVGSVNSIGIGLPELVDPRGRITSAHTIDWRDWELSDHLPEFESVVVAADVRAAARAEARFGAGKQYETFVLVSVGTGISSTLVQNGRPYAGARGNALILGSGPTSTLCSRCGSLTHTVLEDIASGKGMTSRYNALNKTQIHGVEEILEAVRQGDTDANRMIEQGAEALGSAIGWVVNVLDPQAIILSGGLGLAEGQFRDALIGASRRHVWADDARNLPIIPAQLGPDAGFIGAAVIAEDRKNASPTDT